MSNFCAISKKYITGSVHSVSSAGGRQGRDCQDRWAATDGASPLCGSSVATKEKKGSSFQEEEEKRWSVKRQRGLSRGSSHFLSR